MTHRLFFFLLISIVAGVAGAARAQDANRELLRERFYEQVQAIVDSGTGVTGFVVKDLTTGDAFEAHADLLFPQASAIKIPILVELMKQAEEGRLSLDERVDVHRAEMVGGAGILQHFGNGTSSLSIRDLAVLMIVLSDNTATNILIDRLGTASVNGTMAEAGFPEIRLGRRMMDAAASARNEENVASPRAAAGLLQRLYERSLVSQAVSDAVLDVLSIPKSSFIERPPNTTLFNKTGGLEAVDTEWAIVDLARRPYVIVFMSHYDAERTGPGLLREVSRRAGNYFRILARASAFGVQINPALIDWDEN